MSDLLQTKSPKYLMQINQGEDLPIGSFKGTYNFKIVGVSLLYFITGNIIGNEKFVIDVYSTRKKDSLLFSSDEFTMPTDLKTGANWLGWLKFDFNQNSISKDFRYFMFLRQVTYTPDPASSMALAYDFHDPQYDNGEVKFYKHALAFKVEGAVEYAI